MRMYVSLCMFVINMNDLERWLSKMSRNILFISALYF